MKRIDESANVDPSAIVGEGTTIWQNCIIQNDVVIGENCIIGANVFVEKGVRIGSGVKIKNNIAIYSGAVIEDDVFLGSNCVFTNVINSRAFISRKHEFKSTVIRKGATIGANATLVCGHTIGRYAMVGAGSVITHDVDDYSIIMGNPGRLHGYVCECGYRLDDQYRCTQCGKEYEMVNNVLINRGEVFLNSTVCLPSKRRAA